MDHEYDLEQKVASPYFLSYRTKTHRRTLIKRVTASRSL